MKDKTIDYVLRTTWLAVQKMYNEDANYKKLLEVYDAAKSVRRQTRARGRVGQMVFGDRAYDANWLGDYV